MNGINEVVTMRTFTALITILTLTACDEIADTLPGADEAAVALDAVEATRLSRLEMALTAAVVEGIPLETEDTAAMAAHAADSAESTFGACATASTSGSTVTYTFDDCDGPRGLTGLTGMASATFSVPASESVTVSLTASELAIAGGTMTTNVTGTYSMNGEEPLLALQTSGVGQTEEGIWVGRVGGYAGHFDDDCVEIDGQWTSSVDQTYWTTAVQGYRSCSFECPESGVIGHAGVSAPDDVADPFDGTGVVVTLDGDDNAMFVDSEGDPGLVRFTCP